MEEKTGIEEVLLTPAEACLQPRELAAYRAWAGLKQPRLSPDNQVRLYALFLKGESCDDIVRLNRGYSLGQICQARVENEWDKRRDEYLQDLFAGVRSILQQSTMESVRFISDQLAAVHKKFGESARRYVQSGDDKDFNTFGIDDIRSYKNAVETLQKITGQEKKPEKVEHNHRHEVVPVAPVHRAMNSAEASQIIKSVVATKVEKK